MTKIVFDLGASNTRVARVERGSLAGVLKRPSPPNRDEWSAHLLEMIEEVADGVEAESVTGGVAGVKARQGIISALPNARVYNDALMAGLGESVYGVGKDAKVVGYIGLGTGIGTSRIVDKRVDSTGFEAGHHIIDITSGISWEEKVSGRILKEKYGKYPKELDKEVYEDCVRSIAVGVYNAILFWSPEVLVMGGALINEKEGFEIEDIVIAVGKMNRDLPAIPPILKSELGDDAGLYGSMALADNAVK